MSLQQTFFKSTTAKFLAITSFLQRLSLLEFTLDMTLYAFGCEKFVTELSARPTSLRLLLIVGPNQEHLVV